MTVPFTSLPIPTATIGVGAANRAALAATSTAYGAVYLMEAGREGTFVWSSSNLSTQVAEDTQQGIYVAPSSDATGASGAWVRPYAGTINATWFGAVGNTTSAPQAIDSLPAFNAALAYLRSQQILASGLGQSFDGPVARLLIPQGIFYLSGPLDVHVPVQIIGAGGNHRQPGSLLLFGLNQWGVVFHEFRTTNNGGGNASADAGLGDATGSILEGVVIFGGGAPSPYGSISSNNRAAHGIWIRTGLVTVRDTSILYFSGNAININATSGSTGTTAGNANLFRLERNNIFNCSQDGISIAGNDANAGFGFANSVIDCGGSGIADRSFLGNTWVMNHVADVGGADPLGSGALNGTCTYLGSTYYIVGGTNESSQATLASTTTPGTNSAVWAPQGIVGSPPTWTTGQTWRVCAPYMTAPGNVNTKAAFFGNYAELGQALTQTTFPTLVVGGALTDLGFDTNGNPGIVVFGTGNGFQCNQGFTCASNDGNTRLVYGSNDGTASNIISQTLPSSHAWNWQVGTNISVLGTPSHALFYQLDNSAVIETIGLADDGSNFGPRHHSFGHLILGQANGITDGNWLGSLSTPSDLNGATVRVGDTFIYSGRGTRPLGMSQVCIGSGTVGSTATMIEIGQPAQATPFANLPSSPKTSQIAAITDSATTTWGATASGTTSGGVYALLNYNGSNWTVIGK